MSARTWASTRSPRPDTVAIPNGSAPSPPHVQPKSFLTRSQWDRVNSIQREDPLIYEGFAGAFASFFQTGDPNAHKLTNASEPGVPESGETEEEFVVEADGFANLATSQLAERCGFWRSVAYENSE